MKKIRPASLFFVTAATVALLAGCSSTMDLSNVKAIVDLRAASAFAAGHLKGAVNYDAKSEAFIAEVSGVGRHGEVLVYCDTDECGGAARTAMLQIGFDNVINLGNLNEAASTTGLAIVTN